MKPFKILSPTAILGYSFPETSFMRGMKEQPDLIAVDAGSVDPGPYYLGSGKSFTSRAAVKRDLSIMLREARRAGIPCIVGTAGGAGAKPHVDWCLKIIHEIAAEQNLTFTLGVIYTDIDKDTLRQALFDNQIAPLHGIRQLKDKDVNEAIRVVAQIGVDPFVKALEAGCDVILAGRAYDPACFAALPIMLGYDPGLALHLGKILECAAIAADPGSGSDSVLGILHNDYFELQPLSKQRRFTETSVAAHSLYEKSDPCKLPGPGGVLDLSRVSFTEVGDGRVRVTGSSYLPDKKNMLKLEGVRSLGFRTVSIAGTRDPIMIKDIDKILSHVADITQDACSKPTKSHLYYHLYGKNGVMGAMECERNSQCHELGIVIEALAPTQVEADNLCATARSTLLHYGYPGRISTAGNLAFPFSPSDLQAGEAFEFSIYHLISNHAVDPNQFKPNIIQIN